jgi:hypothetical protein
VLPVSVYPCLLESERNRDSGGFQNVFVGIVMVLNDMVVVLAGYQENLF